jgi:DNA-binding NarL/FixJ family response regulator
MVRKSLVSFRANENDWEKFKSLCYSHGEQTATSILNELIAACVSDKIDIAKLINKQTEIFDITRLIDERINAALDEERKDIENIISTKISNYHEAVVAQKSNVPPTGLNNEQLAEVLGVSAKTVKNNRTKLNYKNYHFVNGYWYELK